MVVVRCLIVCSKFTKNRLSAGLRPGVDHLGSLQRSPDHLAGSWGKRGERGDKRTGGKGSNGEKGAREKDGRGSPKGRGVKGYPHRMKFLATALEKPRQPCYKKRISSWFNIRRSIFDIRPG